MSYDFEAKLQDPQPAPPIQAAIAEALGVSPRKQLLWRHEDEWVQVSLEVRDETECSRAVRPKERPNLVSIHSGLSSRWRSWDCIFRVARAIRQTTGARTQDLQREQYLDDPHHPAVADEIPRAISADLGLDGRLLCAQDGRVSVTDGDNLKRFRLPQVNLARFFAGGPRFLCGVGDLFKGDFRVEVRESGRREPISIFDKGWPHSPSFKLCRGPAGSFQDNFGYSYGANGKRARVAHLDGTALCAVSPDGTRVLEAEYRKATLRDPGSDRVVATVSTDETLLVAAFSPDGKQLATYGGGKRILIRNAKTGKVASKLLRCGDVTCLEFVSPNCLASGSRSGSAVRVWDLSRGRSVALKAPGEQPLAWEWPSNPAPVEERGRFVVDLHLVRPGRLCVETSDHQLVLWDLSKKSWTCRVGVLAEGSSLVLAADGRWEAPDDLDQLAWGWQTDARTYANLWLRSLAKGARTPGLLQELLMAP